MQLSREQVLAAALGLLDEAGLEQLTMRRLAAALGVQNGATYWHFRSKQDLLEAMADTLLAGLTAGSTDYFAVVAYNATSTAASGWVSVARNVSPG